VLGNDFGRAAFYHVALYKVYQLAIFKQPNRRAAGWIGLMHGFIFTKTAAGVLLKSPVSLAKNKAGFS